MKVLFLDIDGCVKPFTYNKTNPKFPVGPVEVLNKIIKDTDCKIVLSSSWRYHYNLDSINELFLLEGIWPFRVIGMTPIPDLIIENDKGQKTRVWSNYFYEVSGERVYHVDPRGYEINLYLREHPEITKYAVLEDEADLTGIPKENIFLTNQDVGLTMEDARNVIEFLNKE